MKTIRRVLHAGAAAVLLAAGLTLAGPAPTASAAAAGSDPGACVANGRTSAYGPQYVCGLWRGNVPVYSWPYANEPVVGYLYEGGRANWFTGQCRSYNNNLTPAYFHLGGYYNSWWAYTMADNGKWGWVNLVYFAGGDNDQASAVLPSAC
ncbi:hypothetical protein ACFPM3_20930 [Streptomyces coeruleoprunus]|uniref:Peptidase inhibitor family I36 n=1 Tax=Streptomyces coeruleoprunus TaxID=285563 RepID=A0ABV9XM48_9ACTN